MILQSPEAPARVVIASLNLPGDVGGLAAYQKHLAENLEERAPVRVCFARDFHPLEPSPLMRRLWVSLASRPAGHALLEFWIQAWFRRARESLPAGPLAAAHFVGTGWDFLGFSMKALARERGARFTIWPAIHPGQWGDDVIDFRLYRSADAIFCQSSGEQELMASKGISRTVHCGLPPLCPANGSGERLRAALGLGDRPVVLFLGLRAKTKGLHALLRAWGIVSERMPEAVLLLAGPDHDAYSRELDALPRSSWRDLGVPDEQGKADAYAACTIFCMPSSQESFGIVYVEAWSYGRPVICGPAPASRELIKNGETGLHADQTPQSVAEALLRLLANPAEAARMGRAGRAFQRGHLTWERVTDIHLRTMGLVMEPQTGSHGAPSTQNKI